MHCRPSDDPQDVGLLLTSLPGRAFSPPRVPPGAAFRLTTDPRERDAHFVCPVAVQGSDALWGDG